MILLHRLTHTEPFLCWYSLIINQYWWIDCNFCNLLNVCKIIDVLRVVSDHYDWNMLIDSILSIWFVHRCTYYEIDSYVVHICIPFLNVTCWIWLLYCYLYLYWNNLETYIRYCSMKLSNIVIRWFMFKRKKANNSSKSRYHYYLFNFGHQQNMKLRMIIEMILTLYYKIENIFHKKSWYLKDKDMHII